MQFPKGFLWGTATAAHQIEGNNTNSDWWHWEQNPKIQNHKLKDPSGIACDSYNRYEEDFDLCKNLNNNAIRISIEWARLEPKKGEFNDEEFEHYKKVLIAAKSRGLATFVTLHHFTHPLWFIKNEKGWEKRKNTKLFAKYALEVAKRLDEYIDVYTTINEPHAYTLMGYIMGQWIPQKRNLFLGGIVHYNMVCGHKRAYKAIKSVSNKPVGIVRNISWFEPGNKFTRPIDYLIGRLALAINTRTFLDPVKKHIDYIGLNYYFANIIEGLKQRSPSDAYSDLGWSLYPEGIYHLLKYLHKKYKKPLYITENGLADHNDRIREFFLKGIVKNMHRAIKEGVDLKGYFHWSLLDNFEWAEGYWPRFGLVEIDRENDLERRPRKSYNLYATICRENGLPDLDAN